MWPVQRSNKYRSLDNLDIKPCECKLPLDGLLGSSYLSKCFGHTACGLRGDILWNQHCLLGPCWSGVCPGEAAAHALVDGGTQLGEVFIFL